MELYGSLFNISGSVTASAFTGSFVGDGSGLFGIQASGVTGLNLSQIASGDATASITTSGFTVNKNTQIQGNLSVSGALTANEYIVSSSVIYMTTSFASGSSAFGDDLMDTHKFTGSVQISGSISLNGVAIGTGKLDETTFQSYTSSNNSRVTALETSSGSLNSFTSSINTTIKSKLDSDNVISGSAQVVLTGTTGYSTFSSSISTSIGSLSSSIATTDSNQEGRLNALETSSGSLNSFTSSINTTIKSKLDTESVISGSAQVNITGTTGYSTFSSSISNSINDISGAIATTTSGLTSTITSLSSSLTSSIGELSSSVATTTLNLKNRVDSIETSTGSLNSFTSSINTTIKSKLDAENVISGSVQVNITGTTGYNTFSSSVSSSIGSLSSSVATTTNDLSSSLTSSIGSLSSSVATTTSGLSSSIGSLSSSVATTTLNQSGRLTSIEGKTGSYATTGSNIFQGDQTITGSLYVSQNLIIAGSSSIQNISSSVLNIADNIITVNAINPSVRFGGLAVIDSGSSPQVSGSILFDSVNNQWLFVHQNQTTVTSSVLLMGPETYNNVGNETYITANRLVKSTGIEHLTNSNISDDGTTVTILSNTIVNGTFSATGTTLVSGSSQISHDSTTGYVANRHIDHTAVSISAGNGLSGGGDISSTRTISLDTTSATFTSGVKTKMNADGVVSGSSQITYGSLSSIPSGIVSGSSQITFGSISSIPSGLVSGSSQIDLTSTTNYASGILTRLNAVGVFSGSAQVTGIANSQLTNSSFHVGTTSISLGRTSASQTLTGVSVDGTAGSISGFNNPTAAATANTIAYRDGSGDLYARYFLGGYVNTSDDVNTGTITHIMAKFGDNYHRSATAAKVQSFLGLGSAAYQNTSAFLSSSGNVTVGGYLTVTGAGTSSSIYMSDSDEGQREIHCNSNRIGFLTQAGSWGAYCDDSGNWTAANFSGSSSGTNTGDQTNISGNAATAGGFTPSQTSGTANRIVVADGNGYIINNYFNASGGGSERNASGMGYFAGHNSSDYYYRSYTAAAAAALLSGQAMNISGNATTASSTATLSSNAVSNGYLVIGGNYSNNAYNAVAGGTRLMFGGGDTDAQGNYYIGTNMENYGGNYNKLDLRWHTGIRMGAQQGYGGIRFFNDEDLSSVLFSIGAGDGNVRSHTNLLPSANNSYNLGSTGLRWANIYTNDLHLSNDGKEGGNEIDGTTGDWTIQEGEENLYIINHKNGKKFKIDLTEIV